MATFNQRMKELRAEKNITLEELAKVLNTTKSTLSRYENNLRIPNADFINQLAKYFNVSTDYLLGNTDIKESINIPQDYMFDKENFKFLIEKAMGNRKISQYAEDSGVNRTYLSKYINQRLDNPPTPDILKRLSNSAHNNVTYNQLMMAAGYITTNDKKSKNIKQSQKYTTEDKELLDDISSLDDNLKKEAKKYIELLKLKQNIDKGKSEQSATSEKDA